MITIEGREEILNIIGELLKFTFNKEANEKVVRIIKLIKTRDKGNIVLGTEMLNQIFHNDQVTTYIVQNYTKSYWSKDIMMVGTKFPIGFLCFKYAVNPNNNGLEYLNDLDDTQYKKHRKRLEKLLTALKKYDKNN